MVVVLMRLTPRDAAVWLLAGRRRASRCLEFLMYFFGHHKKATILVSSMMIISQAI